MDILQVLGGLVKPKRQYTKLEEKQCMECGKWFKPKTVKQKCCCKACQQAVSAKKSTVRSVEKSTHVCQNCGKQYRAKRYDRVSFCGRACAIEYKQKQGEAGERKRAEQRLSAQEAKLRTCLRCGCEFKPHAREKYCSEECRKARNSAKGREKYAQRREEEVEQRACRCCGVMFTPTYGNKRRLFCSKRCADRHARREQRKKVRPSFNARGRDVLRRIYGDDWRKHYESINVKKVYERDGCVCGICGEPIDMYARAPSPLSPSVDHVVALSRGGAHKYGNLRAAHFGCNSKRGAG